MKLRTRRQAVRTFAATAAAAYVLPASASAPHPAPARSALTLSQEALLDDLERRGCLYFVEQVGAASGQVLDRARADNTTGARDPRRMSSIAATGFGLAALCIADHRHYLDAAAIREQVLRTLRFHAEQLPHEHGFFYHFNDVDTGEPHRGVEVSSIDTALLLCGVLTARAHFARDHSAQSNEIVRLATAIYNRVDWLWMLDRGTVFSMGWHPGKGFLKATWNHYCELMMIPLLAMGSPTYPAPPVVWGAWTRPNVTFDGLTYISGNDPLFTHQYSHAFFDFRGRRDSFADYFANSVTATRAHKRFCLGLGAPYADDYWGISASDSATGYQAWGGPPKRGGVDGSVVPYAAAGSLPFLPAECLQVLTSLKENYAESAWGRYGFTDALNPQKNWYNPDVLGIDQGIGVLMAENLRSGFIWSTFARNPEVSVAMHKAGFRSS